MTEERTAITSVLKGSERGQKTYSFNEDHDPKKIWQFWYQESNEGLILFVVFYSLACRWSRCLGCNLPSQMSAYHVGFKDLMAQVDHVFGHEEVVPKLQEIRKLIVSNNGSIFDEATFSSTALLYLLAKMNVHLPNLDTLTVETRPEYVEEEELFFMSRALKEGETHTDLEVAIGFEAYDDTIRNEHFLKGTSLDSIERLVAKLARFGFRLKCYFMLKPIPGLSEEDAVQDIRNAIDYLSGLADQHKVEINMHLNPTYVATGTQLVTAFESGDYAPPTLHSLITAASHAKDKPISIFLGLYDEGLAVPGGSFRRPGDDAAIEKLERFNREQDFTLLDEALGCVP